MHFYKTVHLDYKVSQVQLSFILKNFCIKDSDLLKVGDTSTKSVWKTITLLRQARGSAVILLFFCYHIYNVLFCFHFYNIYISF